VTYFREKTYNSDLQIWAMQKCYPSFSVKKLGKYNIEFTGELLVKKELPVYLISVAYRGDNRPLVKIIRPTLVENAPHIYSQSGSLCLYHPKKFKWYKERLVANEIMGWAAAWIYFYEVWMQTGEWYGPEAPHDTIKN
jgi:hypothetical protein